jgi:starch synthase (maltosyl-transferring)
MTPPKKTIDEAGKKSSRRKHAAGAKGDARKRSAAERIPAELGRRVWIENVQPAVDGGAFPIKRTVGETVRVTADIFTDGHDAVAAVLRWRRRDGEWNELPMRRGAGDSWWAEFPIESLQPHEYCVAGWIDRFGSWRDELAKKHAAAQDVESELLEGGEIVGEVAARAAAPDRRRLAEEAAALRASDPVEIRVERALSSELREMADRWPDRSRETVSDPALSVDVNRPLARFGAWYEMFPRSAGPDSSRSATFQEAERRLAEIAEMGFDVLYLAPVHPIGKTHRKGPNNALDAEPGDPGSPWAIGSREGGHKAIHPGLGTLEDFDRFVAAARGHGLEVALDVAFQCSPDHPYVRKHPEWFRHRPDGSIKHAENPPKKYEDIYPFDFDGEDWRSLWAELLDVVLFWSGRGIRIFRVDNPHTKPLRFWGWLIAEVKRRHPETIFLSEAFTRPTVMHALAKVGFDQSYTYFTWRNTSSELVSYVGELTAPPVSQFLRPNFFANTPDILPEYLQFGGRAGFQIRLVLAATLAASYGIYSGYELVEAEAVPGTEEYLGSEKYQIRHRDWDRPESLRDYIGVINTIRRGNPALSYNHRLRFHPADNPQLLCYSKTTADLSNIVIVVVNLDPHHAHDGWIEVPVEEYGIGPEESYQVHDLIGEGRYLWQGTRNYVRLDPGQSPAQIFRVRRRTRTERDFDYFM